MDDMVRVTAGEFGRAVGRYQDMALSQPVLVTRNGRDRTVMISVEEYHRLKRRDRRVLAPSEFPPTVRGNSARRAAGGSCHLQSQI